MAEKKPGSEFDLLAPRVILQGIELTHGLELTDQLMPYPSYVNRVYGLKCQEGVEYIAKFYRPGRWSFEGILEEHEFLADCAEAEIPLAVPIVDEEGETLGEVTAAGPDGEETTYFFALFPKKGGRQFDAEQNDDWIRMGSLLGRLHQVGRRRDALQRPVCSPVKTTLSHLEELIALGLVHSEAEADFEKVIRQVVEKISPLFDERNFQRIHGDCHRGNILDRQNEGLLLIDFDDMMTGPVVQDMWLLLPDYAEDSRRELFLLLEGYEEFLPFDYGQMRLLEPLRFMRIVHYILWCARQRRDTTFLKHFPDWGSRTYWIKETEDLKLQADRVYRWINPESGHSPYPAPF